MNAAAAGLGVCLVGVTAVLLPLGVQNRSGINTVVLVLVVLS